MMSDNPWPKYHEWLNDLYQENHEKLIKEHRMARPLSEEDFRTYDQLRNEVMSGYKYCTATEDGVNFRLDHNWELVGWRKFSIILYIMRKRVKK